MIGQWNAGSKVWPYASNHSDRAEHEADHDQPVRPADGAELVHPGVRDELDEHLLEAREERAPSVGGRLADA